MEDLIYEDREIGLLDTKISLYKGEELVAEDILAYAYANQYARNIVVEIRAVGLDEMEIAIE